MNLVLYYDFDSDGKKRPLWLSVDSSIVNWDNHTHYVDCSKYDTGDVYSFTDDIIGLSVHLDELVINRDLPGQFGINLKFIKHRTSGQIDPTTIERFMVQVVDVVEVLAVNF